MFITKDGKFFGKVSIIDVIVVIAVIVLAVGFYFRIISPMERVVTTEQRIEYEIRVHAVRESTADALGNMGEIADFRTGEELGEIIGTEIDVALWEAAMADGNFVAYPVPDRHDVIVTVQVNGGVSDTGFFTFQNRPLAIGSHMRFMSKYAETSGEIISIRVVEDN